MKIAIVTVVSKGLGTYIAEGMLHSNIHVIGTSRSDNKNLKELANNYNLKYTFFPADLCSVDDVSSLIERIKETLCRRKLTCLYVINNAAIVSPVNRAETIVNHELQRHIQINIATPMMLINTFLKEALEKDYRFIGVTISSGAANQPFSGWSAYCSAKASMNMYTRVVALEQEENN